MSEGDAGIGAGQGGQSAPPGWYPDPRGSGSLFYWDGARWTGDVSGPSAADAPSARAGASQPRDRARLLVIGGAAAFAISPFFTWVKVILFGNLSLFQLFQAAGDSEVWGWVVVAVGIGTAVLAYRNRGPKTLWRAGMIVGLLGGVISIFTLERLLHAVRDAHGLATVGIGPYVTVLGCIAMVVGAVMARRRSRPGMAPSA